LFFLVHLLVKPGIANGNRCLFGKTAQKIWRILDEVIIARLKYVDQPDYHYPNTHRKSYDLGQPQVGIAGNCLHLFRQLGKFFRLAPLVVLHTADKWGEMIHQMRWDAVNGGYSQSLTPVNPERDHAGLSGYQFDSRFQYQPQEIVEVQFGRHGPTDGE